MYDRLDALHNCVQTQRKLGQGGSRIEHSSIGKDRRHSGSLNHKNLATMDDFNVNTRSKLFHAPNIVEQIWGLSCHPAPPQKRWFAPASHPNVRRTTTVQYERICSTTFLMASCISAEEIRLGRCHLNWPASPIIVGTLVALSNLPSCP